MNIRERIRSWALIIRGKQLRAPKPAMTIIISRVTGHEALLWTDPRRKPITEGTYLVQVVDIRRKGKAIITTALWKGTHFEGLGPQSHFECLAYAGPIKGPQPTQQ